MSSFYASGISCMILIASSTGDAIRKQDNLTHTQSSPSNDAPSVMWAKSPQSPQQPTEPADKGELYTELCARAFKRRENLKIGDSNSDMRILYGFWSHFLVRNFNLSMYSDFRRCAHEDARNQDFFGLTNLITYYDEILKSKRKVIPETLARHYVELVKNEDNLSNRPGFQKLRAAWRNGALDLKSRKRLDGLLDSQLREELESGSRSKSIS